MGKMTAREFLKRAAEDAAFRSQLGISDGMTLSQFRVGAAAAGHDYSDADLAAAARELSEADLGAVAGGDGQGHDGKQARLAATGLLPVALRSIRFF